jgi:hypothetical protein
MSPRGSRRHSPTTDQFSPLIYGGWGDYQEWVDHDFMPRPGFDGRLAPRKDKPKPAPEVPTAEIIEEPPAAPAVPLAPTEDEPEESLRPWTQLVVRPYVRTGGRASSRYDLRLETMVMTSLVHTDRPLEFSDIGRICSLCEVPLSVAELSAYLKAPLGVVRVLVGDAINRGLVLVQENDSDPAGCPSMDLLRRVHDGLRNLP